MGAAECVAVLLKVASLTFLTPCALSQFPISRFQYTCLIKVLHERDVLHEIFVLCGQAVHHFPAYGLSLFCRNELLAFRWVFGVEQQWQSPLRGFTKPSRKGLHVICKCEFQIGLWRTVVGLQSFN